MLLSENKMSKKSVLVGIAFGAVLGIALVEGGHYLVSSRQSLIPTKPEGGLTDAVLDYNLDPNKNNQPELKVTFENGFKQILWGSELSQSFPAKNYFGESQKLVPAGRNFVSTKEMQETRCQREDTTDYNFLERQMHLNSY